MLLVDERKCDGIQDDSDDIFVDACSFQNDLDDGSEVLVSKSQCTSIELDCSDDASVYKSFDTYDEVDSNHLLIEEKHFATNSCKCPLWMSDVTPHISIFLMFVLVLISAIVFYYVSLHLLSTSVNERRLYRNFSKSYDKLVKVLISVIDEKFESLEGQYSSEYLGQAHLVQLLKKFLLMESTVLHQMPDSDDMLKMLMTDVFLKQF